MDGGSWERLLGGRRGSFLRVFCGGGFVLSILREFGRCELSR